jgi:hypothetical protein
VVKLRLGLDSLVLLPLEPEDAILVADEVTMVDFCRLDRR